MFKIKISNRAAFLISLPTITPFIIFCFDFFSPRMEINGVIMHKWKGGQKQAAYNVYLTKIGTASLSKDDYLAANIGDSIAIKAGSILKEVYEFKILSTQSTIKSNDIYWVLAMSLGSFGSLFICLQKILTKKSDEPIIDKQNFNAYLAFLVVGYLMIFVFIYLGCKNF